MTVLLLLACVGEPPPQPGPTPEPSAQPVPAPGEQGTPVLGVQAPVAPPKEGVLAMEPPPPPDPTSTVDQTWLRQPVSHVSQPQWPHTLVDPTMCADMTDGGEVGADGCVTGELKCGDEIIGHTVGGVHLYDTKFYEKKHCWPATVHHDAGNERVYKLTMPSGEWRAWVTLYSPCADLNVAAIRHDESTCPTMDHDIRVCEMSVKEGRIADRIELTTQTPDHLDPTWYVVVEGRDDYDGPFSLHVQCAPGLGGPIDQDRLIGKVPQP
ncbi:MAG: hypothetical protein KC656_03445 [Myxococcales bacterium]|nr:hypothetical protein [Myxococcales bacterium]MCB9692205.1 hypothetical protein [Alphaproteobacteria bacterium]